MEKATRNSLYAIVGGILITIIIVSFFETTDKTLPNYATVVGTVCSLIGFAIAYINIISLKELSIQTSEKVEQALQKVNQLNSVAEISKAIKINQEIQNYIRSDKIELAHLRTLDLKSLLLQFNYISFLKELTDGEHYQKLVIDFSIDLTSINDYLITPKRKVDYSKVVNNLESLSTHLTQFENKLKSINL